MQAVALRTGLLEIAFLGRLPAIQAIRCFYLAMTAACAGCFRALLRLPPFPLARLEMAYIEEAPALFQPAQRPGAPEAPANSDAVELQQPGTLKAPSSAGAAGMQQPGSPKPPLSDAGPADGSAASQAPGTPQGLP